MYNGDLSLHASSIGRYVVYVPVHLELNFFGNGAKNLSNAPYNFIVFPMDEGTLKTPIP
jgi:hypothetical protein